MEFDKSPNLKYQAVTVNSAKRKLRKSAKILHRINKSILFAKEKCGNPQKSFLL